MKKLYYVKKYVEHAKQMFNFSTKVEPWLHVAIVHEYDDKFKPGIDAPGTAWYAIYVWDTRQVVEEGIIRNKKFNDFAGFGLKYRKTGLSGYPTPDDSRIRLNGEGKAVDKINAEIMHNDMPLLNILFYGEQIFKSLRLKQLQGTYVQGKRDTVFATEPFEPDKLDWNDLYKQLGESMKFGQPYGTILTANTKPNRNITEYETEWSGYMGDTYLIKYPNGHKIEWPFQVNLHK